ncbi:LysR family transcriptional regulator [Frankia sp. CNm7]|uniref:LysR family transcriptional regulator n=1 Tax=Frankia nepalensis TaxID=1836974 RepID=A0A937RNR1_9ACTN|nr:LysR substrate-binding domain-containing protein [Frankia nepalensis]MBL7500781.1 LysR family transcriptional regulator [Frankia nepalensis]MBL7515547.1 LysR family transcriptional regulator [Frankia nepalensis]MBL7519091.1 LysR family transcriptional regulator [Frankia nepalensis]MBL7633530.1 LysR family transcriptional regulator [Frankia nepalensis]
MDIRILRSFLAIADELHFGRAAARLHLAQPSLSQQLRRLEREVGVELVARTSHEVRLTPAGQVFQTEARKLIEQADRAMTAAREVAAGRSGWINIGFNLSAAERVLQPALVKLSGTHPGVGTHLWELTSGPQVQGLLNGELDVGFTFGPPPTGALGSREVLRVQLVAVVGHHHEWAGRQSVAFHELASQACMLCRRATSPTMYDTIIAIAQRTSTNLRIVAENDDLGGVRLRITTGPVAGILSLERARTLNGTSVVPIVDPVPTVPVHMVWRPPQTRLVAALLDSVDTVLRERAGDAAAEAAGGPPATAGPGAVPGQRRGDRPAAW